MVNVAKALITREDKILLMKRDPKSKFFPNLWDFLGEKLEPAESPDKIVVREVLEETNLTLTPSFMAAEYDYAENNTPIRFFIYRVKNFSGTIHLSKDHTDYVGAAEKDLVHYALTPIVKLHFKE